jgi:hypothetical protein
MKLNLETELDWIDEEMNLDETVKQNVINAVVNKLQKGIEEKVEKTINNAIDAIVLSKINEETEAPFEEFMNREICLSDKYGDKIKVYPNTSALIKERFDNFMEQIVDENGKTFEGNGYGTKYKRINYIIDKQLKDFANKFTTDAVKTVSAEIKEHVKDGLTNKLGAELMKVLKVNDMLKLNP